MLQLTPRLTVVTLTPVLVVLAGIVNLQLFLTTSASVTVASTDNHVLSVRIHILTNTRCSRNIGLFPGQRRRQCAINKLGLSQCFVSAGITQQ